MRFLLPYLLSARVARLVCLFSGRATAGGDRVVGVEDHWHLGAVHHCVLASQDVMQKWLSNGGHVTQICRRPVPRLRLYNVARG
jgi:hypothetical protein